jgi:hypothetical protein
MGRIKLKWLYLCSTLAKNSLILPYFYVPHSIARELSLKLKKCILSELKTDIL